MSFARDKDAEQRTAYIDGHNARCIDNRPLISNPYLCATSPDNVTLCNFWRDGWLDAARDERSEVRS